MLKLKLSEREKSLSAFRYHSSSFQKFFISEPYLKLLSFPPYDNQFLADYSLESNDVFEKSFVKEPYHFERLDSVGFFLKVFHFSVEYHPCIFDLQASFLIIFLILLIPPFLLFSVLDLFIAIFLSISILTALSLCSASSISFCFFDSSRSIFIYLSSSISFCLVSRVPIRSSNSARFTLGPCYLVLWLSEE